MSLGACLKKINLVMTRAYSVIIGSIFDVRFEKQKVL